VLEDLVLVLRANAGPRATPAASRRLAEIAIRGLAAAGSGGG
jgi:hypothetical protein